MQRQGAVVELRPADQRDEWEASWYRERLSDPALIGAGVVVVVNGIAFLAVPVGGRRRGGYISADDVETIRCLHTALVGRPGFPDVRMHWSTCPSTCHVVEWGEHAPDVDMTMPPSAGSTDTASWRSLASERSPRTYNPLLES